ncbi:MAG: hypothetical protein EOP41_04875 [Sphingobacteriaceae bacterium]|nr:MAG: hypothetical protein EOP41_04875 [Sphingobacteriaceae bacterium]
MKKTHLILAATAVGIVVIAACKSSAANKKLLGKWHSADQKTKLEITAKDFILDEGEPIAESYFTKGDTLFTSYEGSQPYTRFLIKDLKDKSMMLIYPDSTSVIFLR